MTHPALGPPCAGFRSGSAWPVVAAIWAQALLGFGGLAVTDFFARWMHDAVYVLAALVCLASAVAKGPRRVAGGVGAS